MTALQSREQHRVKRQIRALLQTYGAAHLDLACHAAFPFAVTSELLYCLRENFVPEAPWIAVADLLLSSLFDSVGEDLYELAPEVRAFLLEHLARDSRFGEARLAALADFSAAYVNAKLPTNPRAPRELGQEFDWLALACVRPGEAAQQMAARLQTAMTEGRDEERQRWVELIEGQEDMLTRLGLEPAWLWPEETAETKLVEEESASSFPELRWLEFETAQLVEESEPSFPPPLQTEEFTIVTFEMEQGAESERPLEPFEFTVATLIHNENEWSVQRQPQRASRLIENLPDQLHLGMVAVPGGTFLMGSPKDEPHRLDRESPQHQVTVEPFLMGRYPVTQAQWRVVAAMPQIERELAPAPAYFTGDDHPVEQVSWDDAIEFCARLSAQTNRQYRLPTEAEWEYACRADSDTPFHFGMTISTDVANYNNESKVDVLDVGNPSEASREGTVAVGYLGVANQFGLCDMHGNVWEWCQDQWHASYRYKFSGSQEGGVSEQTQPMHRIVRGGSWYSTSDKCRAASRFHFQRDTRHFDLGFRVACF